MHFTTIVLEISEIKFLSLSVFKKFLSITKSKHINCWICYRLSLVGQTFVHFRAGSFYDIWRYNKKCKDLITRLIER